MRARYFLAPLVFPCATRHGLVLLDLKRNRYLGLSSEDLHTLSYCVDGLPTHGTSPDVAAASTSTATHAALLESLLLEGIISADVPGPVQIISTPIVLHGPLTSIGAEITQPSRVYIRHIGVFLFHLLGAAISLRFLPLWAVVRRVYRRRRSAMARGYTFNLSRVSELIEVFRSIRPYFFVAKDHCLLHALALVNFLAHYGEFPIWAFGVSTDPWTAHSWVQHDRFLLDCNPESVCSLDPILGV